MMFISFAGLLLIIGLFLLIPIIAVRQHQKKCSLKIYGKCIGLIPPNWPEDLPDPPYMPTYEILYKGEVIKIVRTVGKEDDKVEIGKEYELYIDPNNPQNFVNHKDNEEHLGRIRCAIGCFVGAAILIVIYAIVTS